MTVLAKIKKIFFKIIVVLIASGIAVPSFAEESGSTRMSKTRYTLGGILGIYPGFGIGHAVQGRWGEDGWKMTVGELAGVSLIAVGALECMGDSLEDAASGHKSNCNSDLLTAGVVTFLVFKVWELVDVWATPVSRNMIAFSVEPRTPERPTIFALNFKF
jgi:hypothetical protein